MFEYIILCLLKVLWKSLTNPLQRILAEEFWPCQEPSQHLISTQFCSACHYHGWRIFAIKVSHVERVSCSWASKRVEINQYWVPCNGLIWIWMQPRFHSTKSKYSLWNGMGIFHFNYEDETSRTKKLMLAKNFRESCRGHLICEFCSYSFILSDSFTYISLLWSCWLVLGYNCRINVFICLKFSLKIRSDGRRMAEIQESKRFC